jgi:hypothetical protein
VATGKAWIGTIKEASCKNINMMIPCISNIVDKDARLKN